MENIIRDRVNKLLEGIKATPNSISENSTEQRKLNRQISEGKTLTVDVLSKILERIPQASTEWLLRGEGTMLKSNANENRTSPINVDGDLISIEMEREIRRLRASLDAVIEKNERLEAELAEYKAKEVSSKDFA